MNQISWNQINADRINVDQTTLDKVRASGMSGILDPLLDVIKSNKTTAVLFGALAIWLIVGIRRYS